MRPEGVAAAQRELKRALRARSRFVMSDDLEEVEDAYDTFLTHAGRIYEKLRAACHGQGVDWMWWKKKMDQRRDDPLLLYIHKTRNTGTHRLEDVVAWTGGTPRPRPDPTRGPVPDRPQRRLIPLPVTDKEGNTYDPPTRHAGKDFGSMDVNNDHLGGEHAPSGLGGRSGFAPPLILHRAVDQINQIFGRGRIGFFLQRVHASVDHPCANLN